MSESENKIWPISNDNERNNNISRQAFSVRAGIGLGFDCRTPPNAFRASWRTEEYPHSVRDSMEQEGGVHYFFDFLI